MKRDMTRQLPSGNAPSGRPASTADDGHCAAFNAAFRELGLGWRWSAATYDELARIAGERDRIRVYLETAQPHLLLTYDADFLIDAIHSAKARCHSALFAADKSNAASEEWPERRSAEAGF